MSTFLVQSTLSPSEVRQIEPICDRFEAAWKAGPRPHLEAYLNQAAAPLRTALLRELLPLDWEYRLLAGERPHLDEYQVRFPAASSLIETLGREFAGAEALDGPPPQSIGGYRILRQVGRGGMGVVYEAVEEPLGRRVALKVLPGVNLADRTARERFRREAQTTARLDHPNLVRILEVGEQDGQPFLALELVAGPTLSEMLRNNPQPPREAAALVETLARAVHYAHEQGIVHRDLKPANVLLETKPREDRRGEEAAVSLFPSLTEYTPRITDFGLAHPVDESELTATGEIVGTPCYMAPEQAWGKSRRRLVGPAADIHALGAILYEALTGRPPFQGATALEALEQVRTQDPVAPSRLQPQTPRDLETVCLKCLEKEPGRRYSTAAALADDLRRFRTGKPIKAQRPGRVTRLARWLQRNPATAAAGVLGVVALVAAVGLAVGSAFLVQLRQEQRLAQSALHDAEQFRRQAERLSADLALERGMSYLEQEEVARGMLWLGRSLQITLPAANDLQHVIRMNLAAAHRRLPYHLDGILEHPNEVRAVAFSPVGKVLLTGGMASAPQRWDAATGAPLGSPLPHAGAILAAAFRGDGTLLATAGADKTARLWDAATGSPSGEPLLHPQAVHAVAFSPDGRTLLTGCADGKARLWDGDTGELRREFIHSGRLHAVTFSPSGKLVATAGSNKTAQMWDADTGKPVGDFMRHPGEVWAAAFSPDGRLLVAGSEEGSAWVWNASTGRPVGFPLVHHGPVRAVGYSPDGKVLWTAGAYGKVRLWDSASMAPLGPPLCHPSAVYAAAWSLDQHCLATASADGKVRLWRQSDSLPRQAVLPHEALTYCLAVSPDGGTVVTGSADPHARLWDASTGKRIGNLMTHEGAILRVAFSHDGRTIATAGADKTVRLWDAADGAPRRPVLEHSNEVFAVAFHPDDKALVTGCKDGTARLWDAASGRPLGKPWPHPGWVHAVAFSPDGATVLTGCEDGAARLWDATAGALIGKPLSHRGPVRAVSFSPDGRIVATATWDDRTARLWDAATGKPLGPPLPHQEHVLAVAFSPDGNTIATGAWDGTARLWDVATRKPLGPPLTHSFTVRDVAFSPDGKVLWTASFDRTVRSWELPVAASGDTDEIVLWIQVLTGMELDQDGLFRELDAAAWRERRALLNEWSRL